MRDDAPLVAVIDDDEPTCRAVGRVLSATGFRVRTFTGARQYLDDADSGAPACVLVDIRMPEVDGLELVRTMRDSGAEVPAVFMTASGDIPTVIEAMKEGAIDLLAKPFTADRLVTVVTQATDASRRIRGQQQTLLNLWNRVAVLTPRESEVCALVASGLLNKHVAALIGTKEKTVKVHRGRAMQKLRASSVAALVRVVDGLLAYHDRRFIKVDGVDVYRPRAADIIVDVIDRRAILEKGLPNAVDQWTIPQPRDAG